MLSLEDVPMLAAAKGVLFRAAAIVPGITLDRIEDKPLRECVEFAIVAVLADSMVESYHALGYDTIKITPYWRLVEQTEALMRAVYRAADQPPVVGETYKAAQS